MITTDTLQGYLDKIFDTGLSWLGNLANGQKDNSPAATTVPPITVQVPDSGLTKYVPYIIGGGVLLVAVAIYAGRRK